MLFWIFMEFIVLLIPLTMIIFGRLFMVKPPEEINDLFGYRTPRSKLNYDTWNFAHRYIGRIWFIVGIIILVPSALAMFFTLGGSEDLVGTVGMLVVFIQLLPMTVPIFFTEAALKRTFDDNGIRRR